MVQLYKVHSSKEECKQTLSCQKWNQPLGVSLVPNVFDLKPLKQMLDRKKPGRQQNEKTLDIDNIILLYIH